MFGSKIVSAIIYDHLSAITVVTAAVGDRIIGLNIVPQGVAPPVSLYYPEFSSYDGALGNRQGGAGDINFEQMRFVIRLICKGMDTTPIDAAADAQLDHFDGLSVDMNVNGTMYYVTFTAQGEVPLTSLLDGGTFYRQLGTTYGVEITRGG